MAEPKDYILGVDADELARLRFQHIAWREQTYALWRCAGFRSGDRLHDLGCGPGFTSMDLAAVVGPTGNVLARDQSRYFLEYLESECRRRELDWVETSLGPVEDLRPSADSFDGAYSRWLFSWLEDPAQVLAAVAGTVRPGGVIALHEYLDWGAMKLVPRASAFDRAVLACMESWAQSDGEINVAEQLPSLAQPCGLVVRSFEPIARIGAVGSLEWRWLGEFFAGYLPKLVAGGLFTSRDLEAFREEWSEREEAGSGYCFAPVVAATLLERPSS